MKMNEENKNTKLWINDFNNTKEQSARLMEIDNCGRNRKDVL